MPIGHLEHAGAHRYDASAECRPCRVLLVGEDNPQSADPRHALYPYPPGCAGHRLSAILDLPTTGAYLALWRTNLCNPRWSAPAARERARVLLDGTHPWDVVILLGAKVRDACGYPFEFFTSCHTDRERVHSEVNDANPPWRYGYDANGDGGNLTTFHLVSLPHPSGRNLIWNDPQSARQAREVVRRVAPELWESLP